MGPFATLLPGVREIRAPLAAGYLWLLALWLAYGGDVPDRADATGLAERLYDLEGLVSALGFGIAVSFVAYLIGTLTEWATTAVLRLFVARRFDWFDGYTRDQTVVQLEQLELDSNVEVPRTVRERWTRPPLGLPWRRAELDRIRTSLMVDHPLIYNDYDRFRSEAELRVAIFIPLTWVVTILGTDFDSAFFFAYGAIVALMVQAITLESQATAALIQSVIGGKVSSPYALAAIRAARTESSRRRRSDVHDGAAPRVENQKDSR